MAVDAALHHLRRYYQGFLIQRGLQLQGHQLPGPQPRVGVGELGLDPDGAGVGRHLIVDQGQLAFAQQRAAAVAVAFQIGLHHGWGLRGEQALQGRQQLLRQRELDADRVDLGNAEQPLGIGDAQEVAFIHIANTYPAADRGANLGIGELHLGGVNRRLVAQRRGLELVEQRLLLVEGLL
ncbi:hypothetical protein D9M71_509660 [compost metagenome]